MFTAKILFRKSYAQNSSSVLSLWVKVLNVLVSVLIESFFDHLHAGVMIIIYTNCMAKVRECTWIEDMIKYLFKALCVSLIKVWGSFGA